MTEVKKAPLDELEELFGSDDSLERGGAWMPVPGSETKSIKLRSQHSNKVRDLAQQLTRKHVATFQAKRGITAKEQDADQIELLALAIVVDWKGFGELLCTPENVRRVMKQYPAFREVCYRWSDERENYRKEQKEAIEGNSSPVSSVT